MSPLRFFLTLALFSSVVLARPWQPARTLSSRLYHLSRKHSLKTELPVDGSGMVEKATESESTESESTESTESEEREAPSRRGYMEVARGFKDDIAAVFAKLHVGQNSANSLDGLAEYLKEARQEGSGSDMVEATEVEKSENRLFDEDMFYMK